MTHSTELPPVIAQPVQRDGMLFNWSQALTPDCPAVGVVLGRYPVTTTMRLFEGWTSVATPSDVGISITIIRFKLAAPAVPIFLGSLHLDAGQYISASNLSADVDRGDQLSVTVSLDGEPVTPATGWVTQLRLG